MHVQYLTLCSLPWVPEVFFLYASLWHPGYYFVPLRGSQCSSFYIFPKFERITGCVLVLAFSSIKRTPLRP